MSSTPPIIVENLQGGYNGIPVIHGCNMEIAKVRLSSSWAGLVLVNQPS